MKRDRSSALTALALALCAAPAQAEPPSPATPLAQAYAVLAAHPKVDLTHAFGPATPVWSGFGQAKMTPAVNPDTLEAYAIARDGFRATYYAMVGQYGTHVDPPAHFAPTGATMDEIPLDQMILPLVVLDDTPYLAADPAHAFSLADLDAWETAHGRVPKGAFVALRTDASVTAVPPGGRRVWLHHGSSISQGSNAGSPTTTWAARAAARGGVDLVNLGFSGSAMLDSFVARTMRDHPADLLSVKIGINLTNADVMRMRAFTPALAATGDAARRLVAASAPPGGPTTRTAPCAPGARSTGGPTPPSTRCPTGSTRTRPRTG